MILHSLSLYAICREPCAMCQHSRLPILLFPPEISVWLPCSASVSHSVLRFQTESWFLRTLMLCLFCSSFLQLKTEYDAEYINNCKVSYLNIRENKQIFSKCISYQHDKCMKPLSTQLESISLFHV